MSMPDMILTCIADHLGIDNVVSAMSMRSKTDSVEEKMGCDHRIAVGKDGRLYRKKLGGRKRAVVIKDVVGLRIAVSDIALVDRASTNRSTYMRLACQRSAYLDHIRSMHDDIGMHTRPVADGWGLFSSDGTCVASGDDEVAMLREMIPYEDLMTR